MAFEKMIKNAFDESRDNCRFGDTIEEITEIQDYIKNAEKINDGLNKILAIAENYPELNASEQFLNLQNNLVKMESQLQAARRIYNIDVQKYNSLIQTVPNNIVAGMFGFKEKDFFQIEEYKKDNININGDNL